jgi:putative phosphonate metabolism protein
VSAPRYAIYAAPRAEEPLWAFGSATVGYDAATGRDVPSTPLAGHDAPAWAELTADPRRYGFHGTLKPPFELAPGTAIEDLEAAVGVFAGAENAIAIPRLGVRAIGRFVALVPEVAHPALERFAGRAVAEFDPFRAALTPEDRARRRPERLSARQVEYLDRWGYPYVFEEFRYHMTLTGQAAPERVGAVVAALANAHAAAVPDPSFVLADLVVFEQPRRDQRFRIRSRHPLRRHASP